MLTREEAVRFCLTLPQSYEDYPFGDSNWTIMRHEANQKMFAAIFEREEKIWINVKADPMWAELWRQTFPAVIPGYHMNKRHWVSIILDGSMAEDDIRRLITDSYDLVAPKRKKK